MERGARDTGRGAKARDKEDKLERILFSWPITHISPPLCYQIEDEKEGKSSKI